MVGSLSSSKRAGLILLGWVVLVTGFLATTTLTDAIPDDRIARTLITAAEQGQWEPGSLNGFGLIGDRYTECVAFTQGLGDDAGLTSAVQYAVADLYLAPDGCPGVLERLQAVEQGQPVVATPYYRYWHGYVLITRPMLAFADLPALRLVMATLLFASFGWLLWAIHRTLGTWPAVAFGVPMLLASDLVALPESLTHAISWTVMFACSALGFRLARKGPWVIAAWAAYSGAVFVFVDFLTNPPAAVVLILLAVLSVGVADRWSPRTAGRRATLAGGMWLIGYAATWATKWLISAAFFGVGEVTRHITEMVSFRLSGTYTEVSDDFGAAVGKNWNTWMAQSAATSVVVAASLAVCLVCSVLLLRDPGRLHYLLLYALAASAPLVWFVVVSNHSQIHAWFTFRSLPAALGCLTAGAVGLAVPAPDRARMSPPGLKREDVT